MTFKEANEGSSLYEIENVFELKGVEDICADCVHENECVAKDIFRGNRYGCMEAIRHCRFFDNNWRQYDQV